jgi:predicted amidohydrolase YtcJ
MIERRARAEGKRFRADAAKIFVDVEIDRHSAAMLEPYADAPDARGAPLLPPDALDALVRRLDAEGFSIHMHVMGDRAVRMGLDAIERAIAANGARDRRHQLAHVGVADPADIPRFAKLGVAADFSPLWAQARDPAYGPALAALGNERARNLFPIGAIAKAGGRVLASSDWPQPTMNPLDMIQYAITRQPLDGGAPPAQPDQRVDLATMLAAYTREGAWAAREEALDGAIAVGKAADLVVLDANLFDFESARIHEARVLLTLLDGQPVWRDAAVAWPGAAP